MRLSVDDQRLRFGPDKPAAPTATWDRPVQGSARRKGRRRIAVAAILALLLGLVSSVGYTSARGLLTGVVTSFTSAEKHLETGKALLATASSKHDLTLLRQATREFEAAKTQFASGQREVDANPLVHVGAGFPVAGRYVSRRVVAVDNLGQMGIEVADVGLRAAGIDLLLMTPAAPGQPKGSKRLLDILAQAQPSIQVIQAELRAANAHAAAVDPSVLPGQQRAALVKAKASLQKGIGGLDEFGRLLPALQEILAANGRRVYLVEQANPFELRAGGGYIGSYTLLAADHGSLQVLKSGDTHDLPDYAAAHSLVRSNYVAPPPPLREFLNNVGWSIGDTNFFPDFAADAQAAVSFAQKDFGTAVDGVISMDLYAVAALLSVTGPMTVPGYDLTVDAGSLISKLVPLDLSGDPAHKKVLSALAGPLMQNLTSLGAERWPEMIKVLNDQANQRHVQLWFASDKAQPEMQRLGLSGDLLAGGRPDFLYQVESNFGANKDNYFLHRSYTLTLTRTATGLHHQLTEGLLLDGRQAPAGYDVSYNAYYRLYVPAKASAGRVSGLAADQYAATAPPAGTALLDGWHRLVAGAGGANRFTVTYAWDTPWTPDAAGREQVYWQKQAGVAADAVKVVWQMNGKTWTANSDLSVDRVLTVGPTGMAVDTGHAASVVLPQLSL